MDEELYKKLAEYEIGWWKAHHRKNTSELIEKMSKLYSLQFRISYDWALKSVKYRVEATKEHDVAEELEDNGNQSEADKHWKNAEDLLKKHFKTLMQQIKWR